MGKNNTATLRLALVLARGAELIIASDDTYLPTADAGDSAMSVAYAALSGETISAWDMGPEMRAALASLAIVWPDHAEESEPLTLRSSQIMAVAS